MFGTNPGTMDFKASLLASHGYASLALAFHGAEGLPDMHATVEGSSTFQLNMAYFDKAINFLRNHPRISKECGIAVFSISGSTPIALLMATYNPHVSCVVCINGSGYN